MNLTWLHALPGWMGHITRRQPAAARTTRGTLTLALQAALGTNPAQRTERFGGQGLPRLLCPRPPEEANGFTLAIRNEDKLSCSLALRHLHSHEALSDLLALLPWPSNAMSFSALLPNTLPDPPEEQLSDSEGSEPCSSTSRSGFIDRAAPPASHRSSHQGGCLSLRVVGGVWEVWYRCRRRQPLKNARLATSRTPAVPLEWDERPLHRSPIKWLNRTRQTYRAYSWCAGAQGGAGEGGFQPTPRLGVPVHENYLCNACSLHAPSLLRKLALVRRGRQPAA